MNQSILYSYRIRNKWKDRIEMDWIASFIAPSQKFSTRFVKTFWEEKLRKGRDIGGRIIII